MSLAPASSRGFFLNARLAVNGIQCAARSFGTLTAVGRGLLSSMGAFSELGRMGLCGSYQLRRATGNPWPPKFPLKWPELTEYQPNAEMYGGLFKIGCWHPKTQSPR